MFRRDPGWFTRSHIDATAVLQYMFWYTRSLSRCFAQNVMASRNLRAVRRSTSAQRWRTPWRRIIWWLIQLDTTLPILTGIIANDWLAMIDDQSFRGLACHFCFWLCDSHQSDFIGILRIWHPGEITRRPQAESFQPIATRGDQSEQEEGLLCVLLMQLYFLGVSRKCPKRIPKPDQTHRCPICSNSKSSPNPKRCQERAAFDGVFDTFDTSVSREFSAERDGKEEAGVPVLTAGAYLMMKCLDHIWGYEIPCISDGDIRSNGNVVQSCRMSNFYRVEQVPKPSVRSRAK